jgi:hypothetical protein
MAKAHDRIQPVKVANLPTAAAAPVPSVVLSTRMSQCPWSFLCVETMRTSGEFSGT